MFSAFHMQNGTYCHTADEIPLVPCSGPELCAYVHVRTGIPCSEVAERTCASSWACLYRQSVVLGIVITDMK